MLGCKWAVMWAEYLVDSKDVPMAVWKAAYWAETMDVAMAAYLADLKAAHWAAWKAGQMAAC
jgi:hypothetical protein